MRNRLASALQVSCQTRPRRGVFKPSGKDQAFGGIAAARRPVLDGVKKATVRSVRTRRSTRSSRGGTAKNIVQGFRSGLDRKMRPECRVDTVNHSASPSRRESVRRVIKCFQSQSAATEQPLVRRCAAAYFSLPSSTRSRASRSQSLHRWRASCPPVRSALAM